MSRCRFAVIVLLGSVSVAFAQAPGKPETVDLTGIAKLPPNAARGVAGWFEQDRGALLRVYALASPARDARLAKYYGDWTAALAKLDLSGQTAETKTEIDGLQKRVDGMAKELARQAGERNRAAGWTPFATVVVEFEAVRRRADPLDHPKAAGMLNQMKKDVFATRDKFVAAAKDGKVSKQDAAAAGAMVADLTRSLTTWHGFYTGYDPMFNWWCNQPYREANAALTRYADAIKEAKDLKDGPAAEPATITPAAGPSDVPDLVALLTEPRSDFTPVLDRYRGGAGGRGGRGGGGGGGRGGQGQPENTDRAKTWLEALKNVEFDKLTRPGQVDYLLLKHQLDNQIKMAAIRAKLGPAKMSEPDPSGIRGRQIGAEMIEAELAGEMIPHTAQDLIDLAEKEYQWCLAEMLKASREMGFGDDWKKALEKVKNTFVPPGKQPELVRDLANEAVAFLRKHEMITVPPICDETWRMGMLSPERQLTSPFFLGGEQILISYPTDSMPYEAKMQSMRGNNPHFSKATVHHELIPGHGLQQYYSGRSNTHRGGFGTAFWTEGWALYNEFVLYEKGFPTSPENKVGMLFWRMHRCARVVFSLGFHTGKMTPTQCIDYLVEKVGHERDNATAEVRRSFEGGYGPLYQLAYLIGGKQFWAIRQELVVTGKVSEKAYHDFVMKGNRMPVEMVRAGISGEKLTPDSYLKWKFWKP